MEQLSHVGQVVGKDRHQLSCTVSRMEIKRQGFVVAKQLGTHSLFHLCSHGMAKIRIRNIADHLYHSQHHQKESGANELAFCGAVPLGKDLSGQIPGNQREQQHTAGAECCKKHIHEEYVPVRLVIG